MNPLLPEFQKGLPAARVDRHLREALVACDHAQAAVVLWLAEVLRRGLCRRLGHPGPLQYATEGLGMSRSRAYDLLQLARDIDRLPGLRASIAAGRLGWTKARLVARVATPVTEERWVAEAESLGRRDLAARIAREREAARRQRENRRRQRAARQAGQGDLAIPFHPGGPREPVEPTNPPRPASPAVDRSAPVASGPVAPGPTTPLTPAHRIDAEPPVTTTLRFSSLDHARFEVLDEQARRRRLVRPQAAREEIVLASMESFVTGRTDGADVESSRPEVAVRYQIVVYRCRECAAAHVVSSRGRRRLSGPEAEAVQCDARVLERGRPNRATIPPSVRAAVMARDGHRCQAPGCGSTRFLEVHHRVGRVAGGTNRPDNLVTLCSRCHRFAHERPDVARRWLIAAAPAPGLQEAPG